ncbi:FecR family protein [Sphingobacterium lumbrici]|uniref:FecR family protein n=1 Tax=Sphingobacterium lumbrici TaxID=2559600 RepID=UPI00112C73EF|nr:FecR family protein [Sphingobacterium lumbrici]
MERNAELQKLFQKFISNSISPSEYLLLLAYFEEESDQVRELIIKQMEEDSVEVDQLELHRTLSKVDSMLKDKISAKQRKPTWLRKLYPYMAAAVVLVVGFVIYQYSVYQKEGIAHFANVESEEIAPGTNKATIIMSDGTTYILREDSSGIMNDEQGIRYGNGNLITETDETVMLQLTTPIGGKYTAVLADGTKVWLNAESSITYPSKFDEDTRRVKVSGEVFFEVAKHDRRKFIAEIDRGGHIEVLGTHFNINAYPDLDYIRTTLLEGAVRVFDRENKFLELKPGQQALQSEGEMEVKLVNTDIVTAWKNDLFNFEGLGFREVMRQMERWYDIEVIYENTPPNFGFYGELSRKNSLQDILEAFIDSGIKTRVEGRKLYIN